MTTSRPFVPADIVKTAARLKQASEILGQPVSVLLGVDEAHEVVLRSLDVQTVFDLANAAAFGAAQIVAQAGRPDSVAFRHGRLDSGLVRASKTAGKKLNELLWEPIDVLHAVPETEAETIAAALGVANVREMALYPPFISARSLFEHVYFPELDADFDPESPPDLIPRSGDYPTERVQYSTLLMDEIGATSDETVDISSESFKPISLASLANLEQGFRRPAFGALLTFNQSWFVQGVTLGQLLHSTALAPGESTRIAVIDWSRRSSAGQTESISEQDDLTNDTRRNRSISEVTGAVADEAQGGFSSSATNSTSFNRGIATAAESNSGLLGAVLGGGSSSEATSTNFGSNAAHAASYSSSWGRRNVASEMAQKINDRTHQHAHSSRSRRASVVKEVAQSEHESISTRVVTNYNHMHALTLQYYEVVQVYRVEVSLAQASKVVFVPFAAIDFTEDSVVTRFRGVLAGVALSSAVADALRYAETVELRPVEQTRFTGLGASITEVLARPNLVSRLASSPSLESPAGVPGSEPSTSLGSSVSPAALAAPFLGEIDRVDSPSMSVLQLTTQVTERIWRADQLSRLSGLLDRVLTRAGRTSVFLPEDLLVEGAAVGGDASLKVVFEAKNGNPVSVDADRKIALSQLARVGIEGSSADRDVVATVTLTVSRNGVRFPVELPSVTVPRQHVGVTPVVAVDAAGVNLNLKEHLRDNCDHYSRAVMRSLGATEIATLLAGHTITLGTNVVPLAQIVEPMPIRYIGNYMAFVMNVDPEKDPAWGAWMKERDVVVGTTQQDLVPLGTGGVFGEAVLGRSNSAEKLDITRFWNWQDSPIPIQPTEIAAIQSGSRATNEDVRAGQLSQPLISMTAPTALPDPVGTAAILAAVQNGSMFRDMSGLQATVGLAQAALQASAAGATAAGAQAGSNMQAQVQAATERMRIAGDVLKSAITAATGPSPSPKGSGSTSETGAKTNYFDKTKGGGAKPNSASKPSSGGGTGSDPVAATGGGGGAVPQEPTKSGGSESTTSGDAGGYSENPAMLAATWGGDSESRSSIVDRVLGSSLFESTSTSTLKSGSSWPHLSKSTVFARIDAIVKDPNILDQGAIGLCGEASFLRDIARRFPSTFRVFAEELFISGKAVIGGLSVSPDSDLRNADYGAIVAKHGAKLPSIPPEADWMLLSALRDSTNTFWDYQGGVDEDLALGSWVFETVRWYEETGFFKRVTRVDDVSVANLKTAVVKTSSNFISLKADSKMFFPNEPGRHVFSLESPFVFTTAPSTVSFDYWSWGAVRSLTVPLALFEDTLNTAVIVEW